MEGQETRVSTPTNTERVPPYDDESDRYFNNPDYIEIVRPGRDDKKEQEGSPIPQENTPRSVNALRESADQVQSEEEKEIDRQLSELRKSHITTNEKPSTYTENLQKINIDSALNLEPKAPQKTSSDARPLPSQFQAGMQRFGLKPKEPEQKSVPETMEEITAQIKEHARAAQKAEEEKNEPALFDAEEKLRYAEIKLRQKNIHTENVRPREEKGQENTTPKYDTPKKISTQEKTGTTSDTPEKINTPETPPQAQKKEGAPKRKTTETQETKQESPSFDSLSPGKRELVRRSYRKLGLSEIKSQALLDYRENKSALGQQATAGAKGFGGVANMIIHANSTLKLMKSSLLKGTELAKRENELKEQMFKSDPKDNELFDALVLQAQKGPEVATDPETGSLEIEYISPEILDSHSKEDREKIFEVNKAANAFSRIPSEWKDAKAGSKEREAYEKASTLYKIKKDATLGTIAGKKGTEEALRVANTLNFKIEMNRFLSENPDVEDSILSIEDKNLWWQTLKDIGKNKLWYMGLGAAGRTAAGAALSTIASGAALASAPLVAAGIGGWRGRVRGKTELSERETLATRGKGATPARNLYGASLREHHFVTTKNGERAVQYNETKDAYEKRTAKELAEKFGKNKGAIENIVNADGETGAVAKIENILQDLKNPKDEAHREKLLSSLTARLGYTERKINEGKMNFGSGTEQIKNRAALLETYSKAAAFAQMNERSGEIEKRLAGYLDTRNSRIDRAKKIYVNRQMRKGVLIGASFSIAGAALADIATDVIPGGDHSYILDEVDKAEDAIANTEFGKSVIAGVENIQDGAAQTGSWLADKMSSIPEVEVMNLGNTNTPSVDIEKAFEELEQPYTVQKGDTIWGILEHKLEDEPFFENLEKGQQRYILDVLEDKVQSLSPEELKELGITSGNANAIAPNELLSLGNVFKNVSTLEHAIKGAGELSEKQIDSIEVPPLEGAEADADWNDAMFGKNRNHGSTVPEISDTPPLSTTSPSMDTTHTVTQSATENTPLSLEPKEVLDTPNPHEENMSEHAESQGGEHISDTSETADLAKQEINRLQDIQGDLSHMTAKSVLSGNFDAEHFANGNPQTVKALELALQKVSTAYDTPNDGELIPQYLTRVLDTPEKVQSFQENLSEIQKSLAQEASVPTAPTKTTPIRIPVQSEPPVTPATNLVEPKASATPLQKAFDEGAYTVEQKTSATLGSPHSQEEIYDQTHPHTPEEHPAPTHPETPASTPPETIAEIGIPEHTQAFWQAVHDLPARRAMWIKDWNSKEPSLEPSTSESGVQTVFSEYQAEGKELQTILRNLNEKIGSPIELENGAPEEVDDYIARALSNDEAREMLEKSSSQTIREIIKKIENTPLEASK